MIHIQKLQLRLPSHLQPRAELIAHKLAETLASASLDRAGRIEHCEPPPIRVPRHATPTEIADAATRGILAQMDATQS